MEETERVGREVGELKKEVKSLQVQFGKMREYVTK